MSRANRLSVFIPAVLILFLLQQSALSFADDTEIFLSHASTGAKPNVLFILDDSISMHWCLDERGFIHYPIDEIGTCPDDTFKSRLEEQKWAFNHFLSEMKNVRAGLMWMNRRKDRKVPNGQIVGIPIDDIEKVRTTMLDAINHQPLLEIDRTPIDSSLYAAARYFNGYPAKQYPGNENFPGHSAKEAFHLKTDIPSPITSACQPNHIILLTDGDAWWDEISLKTMELIGRKEACAKQPGAASEAAERCVPELAQWLHEQDQMPDFEGDQTVNTHVIGLAFGAEAKKKGSILAKIAKRRQFLKNLTNAGSGLYYEAEDSPQLLQSLTSLAKHITNIDKVTFVNPVAVPINSQRTTEQIYYALFKPAVNDRWLGNLKRYRFDSKLNGKNKEEAVIYDANNLEAINANGAFKPKAQSFWSKSPDGSNINQGGAAYQLPKPLNRHLFVEINGHLGALDISNQDITKEQLNATDNNERKALLNYIRGLSDNGMAERDKALGDFIHSAPVPFSYGPAENDQVIIIGSNEGFVHLFNRKTGKEEFAFMPGALLKNIKPLKANQTSTTNKPHPYGVDNTVTVWLDDTNKNGQFDSGEHFYAYVTLRRGGENMYALDITERGHPKLLWQIDEKNKKAKGFARLAQTWSQPVKTKVKIGSSEVKDVLIFAAGYDPTEDNFNNLNDAYRSDTALGNALYIVDAKTGDLLWSASQSGSDLDLSAMKYSIPAVVKAVDMDNDGLADQLVVGDTGGQIWRLFIRNGKPRHELVIASGYDAHQPFAQLGNNDPQNARRFFQEADVALDRSNNHLLINIGSGYRAHPLNTNVNDRFYSLRANLTSSPNLPLTEKDLHQAIRSFSNFNKEQTIKAINSAQGWYLPLTIGKGEKVLSTSLSADGEVFFASYVPANNIIDCQATLGRNYVYRLALSSATPPPVESINTPPGSIASVMYQPLYTKSNSSGIISGGGVFSVENKSFVGMGDVYMPLNLSACDNPKGCKTYWIDLE